LKTTEDIFKDYRIANNKQVKWTRTVLQ